MASLDLNLDSLTWSSELFSQPSLSLSLLVHISSVVHKDKV